MTVKSIIEAVKVKYPRQWALLYRLKIERKHLKNETRHIRDRHQKRYYIIRYSDPQHSGWALWEKLILYACIYADDHHMIPVVDMKNYRNIYQEEADLGKVNAWEQFYEQPLGGSLEDAYSSENYVLCDMTPEWFAYLRIRNANCFDYAYMRKAYQKFIHLRSDTKALLEQNFSGIFPEEEQRNYKSQKLFGICVRGTDYKQLHHSKQPKIDKLSRLVLQKAKEHGCDYFYIATEDYDLLQELKKYLPAEKIVTYKAGNVKKMDGYIGRYLRSKDSAYNIAIDYLTILYILDQCSCLAGGVCGATVIAQYRKNPPYEYLNIFDNGERY